MSLFDWKVYIKGFGVQNVYFRGTRNWKTIYRGKPQEKGHIRIKRASYAILFHRV